MAHKSGEKLRRSFPAVSKSKLATGLLPVIHITRVYKQKAGREFPVGTTHPMAPNDVLFGAFLPVNLATEVPLVFEFRQDHVRMLHAPLAAGIDGLRQSVRAEAGTFRGIDFVDEPVDPFRAILVVVDYEDFRRVGGRRRRSHDGGRHQSGRER